MYISSHRKVEDIVAKTHEQQLGKNDALLLMRTAVILRKSCLKTQNLFNGNFPPDCLTSPVPEHLRSFINVILQGPAILLEQSSEETDVEVHGRAKNACVIAQQIICNTSSGTHHATKSNIIRHRKEHETPFPLYHGLKLHGGARQKKQVELAHELGIFVSYNCVMEIKRQIACAVCKRHAEDGIVLPTNLRSNVFVTFDVDNLDSRNQSNFSQDEFHGTTLSATNHLSWENQGVERPPIVLHPSDTCVPQLPESYTVVQPTELPGNHVFVPKTPNGQLRPSHSLIHGAKSMDESWLERVSRILQQDAPLTEVITWSGHNSQHMSDDTIKPDAITGVFPLFPDKAATPSVVQHAMKLSLLATDKLNPGQSCVLGADQPIYALAKQLQWAFPNTLGEGKLVMMMGALHIEDKMHQMIGKVLRDTGWTTILSQAQVLTSGRAEPALDEHHIKRTRYAHEVSLMGLEILKQRAYSRHCSSVHGPPESYEMWATHSSNENPTFRFWCMVMNLELLMCRFIRSLREGNFHLYVQVCDELFAWFHVMDHINYARWLPVHVRNMVQLADTHPQVYAEFLKGNFVVQKSSHKFSLIAKDQCHEQCNKSLQAHGGAAGLYENPEALTLFLLAGPDSSRCIEEFEAIIDKSNSTTAHHEEASSLQAKYKKDVL